MYAGARRGFWMRLENAVIWYQNLRLMKVDTMVKKLLKSDHKQGSYSHSKKSYYLC